jgi:hypothetical protein
LKAPKPLRDCSSEGAPLMPEELTFKQRGWNCCAVKCYKTVLPTRTGFMDGLRDHFLAGASLALDEDGAVCRRHNLHVFK